MDKYDDLIDSRDVIARVEELREQGAADRDHEEEVEYVNLIALAEKGADSAPDWTYGETLVRDSYFKDYAQELADDLGLISDDAKWPATCIDWDRAARELQQDYTSIKFDGVTYWVR